MARYDVVTFLTDYGLADVFVGLCHAALVTGAPHARVVDLTHAIARQDVCHGAGVLADCMPFLPPAVHLAVVDPGVGTVRRPVVVAAGDALLVGPDNGLLWPAAERLGGAAAAWGIAVAQARPAVTFDGRDVFAPAAARLAAGADPDAVGPRLGVEALHRLTLPEATVAAGVLQAEVVHADAFGNVQLSARAADLEAAGLPPGAGLIVAGRPATRCETFADVAGGDLAVLPDAFGRVQVAVNRGSAAVALGLSPGDVVVVALAHRPRGPG